MTSGRGREIARRARAIIRSASFGCEVLEDRVLLSGSNALDRLNFGNLASEAAHDFEPGLAASQMPILGVGTTGASAGLTYREPYGSGTNNPYSSQGLTFTLVVSPTKQNYITVKVWGSDSDNAQMYLLNGPATTPYPFIENNGTPPPFPNRFLYYTFPIPLSMTTGQTSTQLTLDFLASYDAYGGTGYHYLDQGELTRPVYSAFSSIDPAFVPDSSDQAGTALSQTPEKSLTTITSTQASTLLGMERNSIYNSYYGSLLNDQILTTSPGSPPAQVVGLDLFTNATTWGSAGKTAAQWDTQVGTQLPQPGYSAVPDELLSVLTTTYLLAPLPGVTISGEPAQYSSSVLTRIVSALDGATYMQGSDGGFPNEGNGWVGLVSNLPSAPTARTPAGTSGYLEGIDTQALGWSIINLLNDPVGGPAFQTYLSQSYNATLTNGGSTLRATAYEQMLYNNITYLTANTGGAESQQMFQMSGLYASAIALEKLQVLYPNSSFVYAETSALNLVKMVMGLAPDTLTNLNASGSGFTNYGLSAKGLGEENGVLSGAYDGGYGLWETMLAPNIADLAADDPGIDATTLANVETMARATVDAFDQFIGPADQTTVNSSGQITSDTFTFDQEDFITYRNNTNPGADSATFDVDTRYEAANPSGPVRDAYALRSAYLDAIYGTTPAITAASTSVNRLNFLRDLPAYESTINSLINVNPATLTPLPGEPGQPDYAWADPQTGAVAFVNDGERFYMNANWRNYEFNNNSYTNLVPSEIARIDDITATSDHAAEIYLPYNSATVQSDGNLSGTTMSSPWIVRYGNYLIVLNHSSSSTTVKLPAGTGEAEDLISHTFYKLGTNVLVPGTTVSSPGGTAAIFWLVAPAVSAATDVGAVGVGGSNSYPLAGGIYDVTGSGAGIGGTADGFHFVSTAVTGNVNLVAEVDSQTDSNADAQAGLMIRSDTTAGAIFAAVVETPADGVQFEWRSSIGGSVAWSAAASPLAPVWLKLSDSNGSVSGYYSLDGSTWTQIGSNQSLSLPATTQVGLAVSSANNTTTSTAVFSGLTVGFDNQTSSPNSAPTIANPASASAIAGTTANLSVQGADDGGQSNLIYTWTVLSGAGVAFSANGTNAAQNTTVTFSTAGNYSFLVTVTDAGGLSTTSSVSLTVSQTFSAIGVLPNLQPVYVASGANQTFTAVALDQFGQIMTGTATSVTWSIDAGGAGSINSSGVYTAPALNAAGSAATVRASEAGVTSGASAVTISGIFTNSLAIGPTSPAGTASYNGSTGTYTVSGSGEDIWVGPEEFRFLYVPFTGDGTFIAQVTDVSNGSNPDSAGNAKAGLMFRANLENESQYTTIYQTYSNGTFFQYAPTNAGSPTKIEAGATGSGHNTAWLELIRSGNTFTGYYSSTDTDGNFVEISSETIAMGETVDVGLVVNSRYTSLPGKLNTSTFTGVSLTGTVAAPTFANDTDIGLPDPTGSYYQTGGVATINAGGTDIYSASDQFNFAYEAMSDPDSNGTVTITARVLSITNTNTNAKAGVMIRNTLAANSAFVDSVVTASNGINRDYRTSAGASASETKTTGIAAPYWVRVTRTGSSFSAYIAPDVSGSPGTWTQLGSALTITMNQTVYVGLAVTSHDNGTLTTASFDNISVTTTGDAAADAAPTISIPVAASANPVTSVNLSVTAADTDGGGVSNLTYAWAALQYPNSTPAAVSFSAAARLTTATFTSAGTYVLQVTVTDNGGESVMSSITVTINQILTSIAVSPATTNISPGASLQLSAVGLDQFGQVMTAQPTISWSLGSGVGIVSASGLYTAPLTGTSAGVQATGAGKTGLGTIAIVNQAPLLASSVYPIAGVNPVNGTSVGLSVLGVDDSGESNLVYSWAAVGSPPGPVNFSTNSNNPTNAAKNTTATFSAAGTYTLAATITDPSGQMTVADVTVVVNQTYTSVSVTPGTATVNDGQQQQFAATALDQFGNAMSSQPVFAFSIDGGGVGSINASGNYSAPASGAGSATIRATSGALSGTAAVTVGLTTIAGTSGSDNIRLVRSGAVLDVYYSGVLTYSVPYATLGALSVNTGTGNDMVTIDFSGGGSPVPAAGITVESGGTDSLIITGTSGNDTASINASVINFDGSSINYLNQQFIVVNSGTGADVLTQTAEPSASLSFNPSDSDATLNVDAGAFNIPASVSGVQAVRFGTLSIASGAQVSLMNGGSGNQTVLVLGALSNMGTLDLGANDMILQGGFATGLAQITGELASGFDSPDGYWNGSSGILSRSAAGDSKNLTTLGVMENTNGNAFDNQPSDVGDILVKYTYYGDADLNGAVNGADYQQIDLGFGSHASVWSSGDFNYDGVVDGSDYSLIDNAFNQTLASGAGPLAIPAVIESAEVTSVAQNIVARRNYASMSTAASSPFSVSPILGNSAQESATDILDGWGNDAGDERNGRIRLGIHEV